MKHTKRQSESEPLKPDYAKACPSSMPDVSRNRVRMGGSAGCGERTAPPELVGSAGAERIAADASRPESSAPHLVIRGAKLQAGRTCGVDWFRVAGPFSHDRLHQIQSLLSQYFGQAQPGKGRWFHDQGMKWEHSVLLLWRIPTSEDNRGGVCIDIPGTALNTLPVLDMLKLMFKLLNGNHCTRIDLREDHRDENVGLIASAKASCLAGELCKARRWETHEPRTHRGDALGLGITIGKRGKDGSGRYVRLYDKGLETGQLPAGMWERLEVEFTDDVAKLVGVAIAELGDPSSDWSALHVESELAKRIREFIYGAVDFRENNGSPDLKRRPRAEWWQKLIDCIQTVTVKQERVKTTLESFAVWVRRCVAPAIYDMANASRRDVGEVVKFLAGNEVKTKPEPASRPIVKEFLAMTN